MSLLPAKPVLTIEASKAVAAAVLEKAASMQIPVSVAVVDDGGSLMYFERTMDTSLASVRAAVGKAFTSVYWKNDSMFLQTAINDRGFPNLLGLTFATPLAGGLPLVANGHVVGAVGVSGGSLAQDQEMGQAGPEAFAKFLEG